MNFAEKLAVKQVMKKFRTKVNKKCDFDFKTVTLSDFELNLVFTADSKILKTLFQKAGKVAEKTQPKLRGLTKSGLDDEGRYEVPADYFGRVLLIIKKNIAEISKTQTQPDGYKIVRSVIKRCVIVQGKEQTKFKIKVGGQYVRI